MLQLRKVLPCTIFLSLKTKIPEFNKVKEPSSKSSWLLEELVGMF